MGALSVHDAPVSDELLCALVALAQQTAAALRAHRSEQREREMAAGHRRCVAELGEALASALNLEGLGTVVCRLAVRSTGAEGAYLVLRGEQAQPAVVAREEASGARGLDHEVLLAVAELASAQYPAARWWQPGAEHGQLRAALQEAGVRSLAAMPLGVRGQPLGVLVVASSREQGLGWHEEELLGVLAAQSAVAIENLQLFEDMQRRLLEMADLTWVSTHVAATLDVGTICAAVSEGAAKALNVPRAAILLARGNEPLAPVAAGCVGVTRDPAEYDGEPMVLGAEVLAAAAPRSVSDVEAEGYADDALVRWLEVRAVACAPLLAPQGLRGLLVVGDTRPRQFEAHTKALLAAYGNQGALALQSALLYQDVVRHLRRLTQLHELTQQLVAARDLAEAVELTLSHACEIVGAPKGLLLLADPHQRELVVRGVRGFSREARLESSVRLEWGEGLAGKAVACGSVLTSADVCRDGRFKYRQVAREEGLHAAVCAPVMTRSRPVGAIALFRTTRQQFTEEEQQVLSAIASSAALAIENAHLQERVQESRDFMFGLLEETNRRMRSSLQVVAGLLSMIMRHPARFSPDDAMRRAISCVRTMAVVHEVTPGREFRFVDAKQVARRVVALITQDFAAADEAGSLRHVSAHVTGARVSLPLQKAESLALVLFELLDNALRHGLAHSPGGRLTVSLADAGTEVVVQVKDNGPGLPPGFDLASDAGLGLSLVKGVTEGDLGGRLELESKGGLTVRVRFPKISPARAPMGHP